VKKQTPRKNSEDSFKNMLGIKDPKLPDLLYKALKLDNKNIDANFRNFIKQLCRNSSELPLNLIADTNCDIENHFGDFSLQGGILSKAADAFRSILQSKDTSLSVLTARLIDMILKHVNKNSHLLASITGQTYKLEGYASTRFLTCAAEVLIEVAAG